MASDKPPPKEFQDNRCDSPSCYHSEDFPPGYVIHSKRYERNKMKEELIKIVKSLKRTDHYHVDADCWFSCPAHSEYCGEEDRICICGLDLHNFKIDRALRIIKDNLYGN